VCDKGPCDGSEWRCFNLRCISRRRLCDGVDDCGDASDESYAHARCPGTTTTTTTATTTTTTTTITTTTTTTSWRLGVVANVVRRMNEVTVHWARLVLGWVTVFGRVYHHGV